MDTVTVDTDARRRAITAADHNPRVADLFHELGLNATDDWVSAMVNVHNLSLTASHDGWYGWTAFAKRMRRLARHPKAADTALILGGWPALASLAGMDYQDLVPR